MTLRACIVSGSRADYGLLYCLLKAMSADAAFDTKLAVTGMHLAPQFGMTSRVIEDDGFRIDERIPMLLDSGDAAGTGKSIGLGVIGFADAFARMRPDLVLLLGDRFEIFAAAQAALVARIPIAHLCGGDTTEGAFDEAMRHCITKMSHLHFVTNAQAEKRVRQLGEEPARVHNVGSTGIDYLKGVRLLDRAAVEDRLGMRLRARNLIVTFHPTTLDRQSPGEQFAVVLNALDRLPGEQYGLIFTKPNADTLGNEISAMIDRYVEGRDNARAYVSLGQTLYLSTLAQVDAMVGNSSSGLYEAPSLGKPAVDIGDRQKGRLAASSVLRCAVDEDAILRAIEAAIGMDCRGVVNPYGSGESVPKIMEILKQLGDPAALVKKHFYDA